MCLHPAFSRGRRLLEGGVYGILLRQFVLHVLYFVTLAYGIDTNFCVLLYF